MNPLSVFMLVAMLTIIYQIIVNRRARNLRNYYYYANGYELGDNYGINSHSSRQDRTNNIEKIEYEYRRENREYAKQKFTYEKELQEKRFFQQSQNMGHTQGYKSK